MSLHKPEKTTVPSYPVLSAREMVVTGRVQGVGFRPFVYRLAHRHGLTGWVRNTGGVVVIRIEGPDSAVTAFRHELIEVAPPLAKPELLADTPVKPERIHKFSIHHSTVGDSARIHIPPDQFACEECIEEMNDPHARRYKYPFINCTQCGPRYTIIRAMPYDRPNTTLAGFALCPQCQAEYDNPLDRRFHAQPLACPRCGPSVSWSAGSRRINDTDAALTACIHALERGQVIGVRGIGGYHILCDAADEAAVSRLRRRKHRPDKPLAVMVPAEGQDGLAHARILAELDSPTASALLDPMRPIVLVSKRCDAPIAKSVAPGLKEIGLLLPYSPLHHLLLSRFGRPVIATSGNLSGEPVLTDEAEAESRLAHVVDAFLHHDRPIERPADDPVLRPVAGRVRPMRLGRGTAPLEFQLTQRVPAPILAVGAFMKTTVALAWEDRVVLSPHIGDLASPRSRRVFRRVCDDLQRLYGVHAEILACDRHPDFPNARWARSTPLPTHEVWHHHAHASAIYGELVDDGNPLLCFTWDGVGLGDDGTLWGGEAFYGKPGRWQRVASWRPFRLPGGDRVVFQPWRTALATAWEAGYPWDTSHTCHSATLRAAWEKGINAPLTTSVGRLFDAAAAMIQGIGQVSYDGQAPSELEALATNFTGQVPHLPLTQDNAGVWRTDWSPLLSMLSDHSEDPSQRSALFHQAISQALLDQAIVLRERHDVSRVGLAGGVFQNRLLTEHVQASLLEHDFEVLLPESVPVNDAGIAFGQIVETVASLNLSTD